MGQCQSLHRQLYAIPMPSTTIVEIQKYGAGETFRKLTFAGNLSDVVSMLLSLYKRESPQEQGKGNLSTEAQSAGAARASKSAAFDCPSIGS